MKLNCAEKKTLITSVVVFIITSLLPEEYTSFDYNHIDGLIRHVKRTRRVGLCGLLHDYQSIYNLDAILSFLN